MSGYRHPPVGGTTFPALAGDPGLFVVLNGYVGLIEAARAALSDDVGAKRDDATVLALAKAGVEMTLCRVLVGDDCAGDLEPGMWSTEGSGVAIEAVFFSAESLDAARSAS